MGFRLDDENAIANVAAFMADPPGYIRRYADHFGVSATAPAAPTPAPPAAPAFERPKPILTSEDGKAAYDAAAMDQYLNHVFARIDQLETRFTPLDELQTRLQDAQIRSDARAYAEQRMSEVKKWDGFEELAPKIAQLMRADKRHSIESAYITLYHADYLPKSEERSRQKFLTELQNRPAAPKVPQETKTRARSENRKGLTTREAIEGAAEKLGATL